MPGNDAFTKILLHFDGGDNAAITDVANGQTGGSGTRSWTSPGAFALTSDDIAPKFGDSSLWCLPVNGGYLTTADHSDFTLGTSDWTVDFWFNRNGATTGARALFGNLPPTVTQGAIGAHFTAADRIQPIIVNSSNVTIFSTLSTNAFSDSNWHHFAMARSGNTFSVYVDGALECTGTSSDAINDSATAFSVGRRGTSTNIADFIGYIDEFRFSVGIARWTAPFTPPSAAYADDSDAVGSAAGTGAAAGVGASIAASVGAAAGTGAALADSTGSGINAAVGTATGTGAAYGIGINDADVVGSCAAYRVRGHLGAHYDVTGEARV